MPHTHEPENITIRPMGLREIDAVERIDRFSFPSPWHKGAFQNELTKKNYSRAWVAENGNHKSRQLIDMIVAWFLVDDLQIVSLAVMLDHRNRGGRENAN